MASGGSAVRQNGYSPYAWRVACETSQRRADRQRRQLRRYQLGLNLTVLALAIVAWNLWRWLA